MTLESQHSSTSRPLITAGAIFAAALAVRLAFCFAAIPVLDLPVGPNREDFFTSTDGYMDLANNLAEHGVYAFDPEASPTVFRAPGYPALLALGYMALGSMAHAVLLVNCLASAITCVLCYLIARRLLHDRAGFWLLAPVTFFPLSIYYCANSFSDTVVTLTVVAFAYALLELVHRPSFRRAMLCGAVLAASLLTKIVILPAAIIGLAYTALTRRRAAGLALTVALVAAALVLPWTYRNYRATGHFVPVTTGLGFTTLLGNFMLEPAYDCDASLNTGRTRAIAAVEKSQGEPFDTALLKTAGHLDLSHATDRIFLTVAIDQLRDDPGILARKAGVNLWRFWWFSSGRNKSLANGLVNGTVILLALLGVPHLLRSASRAGLALMLFVVAYVGTYALIIVHSSRFALPVVMLLLPIATLTFVRIVRRVLTDNPGTTSTPDSSLHGAGL